MFQPLKMKAALFALACGLALGGCQTTGAQRFGDVTTINGKPLPGRLHPLVNVSTMIDTVDANGNRLLVTKGTRKAGTRVGVHVHEYGGHTCVLSGEITDFVQGHANGRYPAGTCYYMPPNTPMSAANLGKVDAVLIDTFILPPGKPVITILEPAYRP